MQGNRLVQAVLRSSLLWGSLVSVGFFALVRAGAFSALGPEAGEFVYRYCASHPVQYVEVIMFFIGMAALVLKLGDVTDQLRTVKKNVLSAIPTGGQTADDCPRLLEELDEATASQQQGYLLRRLRNGLDFVLHKNSADGLDDELKYLADADANQAYGSYSLVRIIIWAIPILGFLGTVIGITLAIASLDPQALENSLNDVVLGLAVAFDTTALALALSIVLMFTQFLCDRTEQKLLARVDTRVQDELSFRFTQAGTGGDPQVAAVRRMADSVIDACGRLVEQQAGLWEQTIEQAQERWNNTAASAQQQMEEALARATDQSLETHAQRVEAAGEQFSRHAQALWSSIEVAMRDSTEAATAQQQELVKQGEVMRDIVAATGQVAKLEETLNRNLHALSGSQNFEETVQSLAATIHLLNARMGRAA